MLTTTKIRKILEKLADSKNLIVVVDQSSNLRIRKRKNVVRIEGRIETDKEYLTQAIQFYLPYLKIEDWGK